MTALFPTNESASPAPGAAATRHILLHHPWGVAVSCPVGELQGEPTLPASTAAAQPSPFPSISPDAQSHFSQGVLPRVDAVLPNAHPSPSGVPQATSEDDADDVSVASDAAVAAPGRRTLPPRSEEAGGASCDPAMIDANYIDWSDFPSRAVDPDLYDAGSFAFPVVLMRVLGCGEHLDSIAWLPHGRAFAILNRERFCSQATSRFFSTNQYEKFKKWMDAFGFRQIEHQHESGAIVFYHQKFLRDQPWLAYLMTPEIRAE